MPDVDCMRFNFKKRVSMIQKLPIELSLLFYEE